MAASRLDPEIRYHARTRSTDAPPHAPELGACLEWTGATTPRGYGHMSINNRQTYVHRWAYEQYVGPVPEGDDLDHLCRNPRCVRPAHLQSVTHRENVLRGEGVTAAFARRAACSKGHPYTEANTRTARDGSRRCRACNRENCRVRHERRRARQKEGRV